jgi:lysophospholipase L1-like esterase
MFRHRPFLTMWGGTTVRRSAIPRKLLLLLVSVFMALALGECAARFATSDLTTTGDNSSYWARRWTAAHVRLNSAGFREREIVPASGAFRVAVVGDSFTYGQGVAEAQRFSNLLEEAFRHDGSRVEFINFGRPGAETPDEVEILGDALSLARPDYVLLQFLVNDFEGDDKSGRPEPWPLVPVDALAEWLHRRSALYYLLGNGWEALQNRAGIIGTYDDYMRRRFGDPRSADSIAAIRALEAFLARSRQAGVPVGIVAFPSIEALGTEPYGLAFIHDRVLEFCRRESLDCLDLRAALAQGLPVSSLVVNRYDSHPGPKAHRIAAAEIDRFFRSRWVKRVRSPAGP